MTLQQAGDVIIQIRLYNGWTHEYYVSDVLVFAPNGREIACALNATGCLHDSTVAGYGDVYKNWRLCLKNQEGAALSI